MEGAKQRIMSLSSSMFESYVMTISPFLSATNKQTNKAAGAKLYLRLSSFSCFGFSEKNLTHTLIFLSVACQRAPTSVSVLEDNSSV